MKILMSGSGSGGHIYPCIATYNYLKDKYEIIVVIFKEIDKKIYDLNNIKYIYIDNNLSTFNKFKQLNNIYKDNKIDITLTYGGKNSIFINMIARINKSKIYLFEQNAIIGKANKFNYIFCNKIFSNFKINYKKEVNLGNPNAFKIKTNKIKLFNNHKITILITLGSLGSISVNKVMKSFIETNNDFNIIYVTGNNVNLNIKNTNNVKIFNYYNPLTDLINIADIVISRAGASTLSEIIELNKPSIIIPSPYVANDHQNKNCDVLVKNNCCIKILEKDLNCSILRKKVYYLAQNETLYNNIKNNLKKMQKGNNFNVFHQEIINDNS